MAFRSFGIIGESEKSNNGESQFPYQESQEIWLTVLPRRTTIRIIDDIINKEEIEIWTQEN